MQNYFWRGKENQDFCGVFGWLTYLKVETSLRGTHFPFQDAWAGGITRSRGNPLEEDSPLVLTGWASQDHSAGSSFDGTHTCPWGGRAMRRCFRDLRLEDTGAPRALTGWRSPFSTRLGADDGQRGVLALPWVRSGIWFIFNDRVLLTPSLFIFPCLAHLICAFPSSFSRESISLWSAELGMLCFSYGHLVHQMTVTQGWRF